MKSALSHFFSWIFLPLLMPTYGLLLTLYIPSQQIHLDKDALYLMNPELKKQLLYLFFTFSALAPGISFFALHKRQIITTIDMENQRERNIPLIIMFAYCLVLYLMFVFKAPNNVLPKYFYALPLSGAIVTGSFMFINRWIKISMHAGGAGILVGYLLAFAKQQAQFEFWIIVAAILASGVTIASRLYLNKHRPIEVYTGWSLALLITFLCNDLYPFLVLKG
jgi:membrane-associated phospholipid phosphatase